MMILVFFLNSVSSVVRFACPEFRRTVPEPAGKFKTICNNMIRASLGQSPRAFSTSESAAFRIVAGKPSSRILLTCEHASNALPANLQWSAKDKRLAPMHWAYDPGSEAFTREFAAVTRSTALLATTSRLFVDVNRPLSAPTLFRDVADNQPIELNQGITAEEKQARLQTYYHPFHQQLHEMARTLKPALVLSCHSYTDCYEGKKRDVEIGVLFNHDDALAKEVQF
jgi:predicted N-formylglutamate amidohydrolase